MCHVWLSHLMSHIRMTKSHAYMRHVSRMNESCLTNEWVMSHEWMSHVSRTNESCRNTCQGSSTLTHWYVGHESCHSTHARAAARCHTHTRTHTHTHTHIKEVPFHIHMLQMYMDGTSMSPVIYMYAFQDSLRSIPYTYDTHTHTHIKEEPSIYIWHTHTHTYKRGAFHVHMYAFLKTHWQVNESSITYAYGCSTGQRDEWVMSHIWMSHVSSTCLKCQWVLPTC